MAAPISKTAKASSGKKRVQRKTRDCLCGSADVERVMLAGFGRRGLAWVCPACGRKT